MRTTVEVRELMWGLSGWDDGLGMDGEGRRREALGAEEKRLESEKYGMQPEEEEGRGNG